MAYDKFKRISSDFGNSTPHERHLARSYERTYLTLFNYDRGSALVMGEPLGFSIAEKKDLVGAVWQWASSPEAIPEDWTLSAMVALRRDVVSSRVCPAAEHRLNHHSLSLAWSAFCCDQAGLWAQFCVLCSTQSSDR